MLPLLLLGALNFTTHFPTTDAKLVIAGGDTNVVYALAGQTLYRSDDGGATFRQRSIGVGRGLSVEPANPEVLYDFDTAKVRRSMDGGATWTDISRGLPHLLSPTAIAISARDPRNIVLGNTCVSRLSAEGGLFRSNDRGNTWSGTPGGVCVLGVTIDPVTDFVYSIDANTYYAVFAFAPQPMGRIVGDATAEYAVGSEVYKNFLTFEPFILADFGAGWQRLGLTGMPANPKPWAVAFDGKTRRLFAALREGLYVSPIGGPYWLPVAAAPRALTYSVDIQGDFLYITTSIGAYRAPLATLAPFTALGALPGASAPVRALAQDPNTGVLYAAGGGTWRSGDAGGHWESSSELAFGEAEQLFISPHRSGVLFAIKGDALSKSIDSGKTWQQIAAGAHALAPDPNRTDVLYAGTAHGLLVSADGGATWTQLDASETTAIAVAPARSSTLYRSANGLQRSDDSGATWRVLAAPSAIHRIGVDPLNESSLWIAGGGKLWHSGDGGATWSDESGNLSAAVDELLVDRDGRHLHVLAGGVWDTVVRTERRRATR
ncbi:MAG TPA: hypothetical protein VJZ76_03910 [Thermoanaerobaculia bacterium]|nr:hypothetical protein [Thermoanaerobaculia bacterium]